MAEQTRVSTPAEGTITLVESEEERAAQDVRTVRLKLRKPRAKKNVQWRTGTVDNEHLNKKKSKCCCHYEKPRAFDESSSESDDECDNCHGHVEKKKNKNMLTENKPPPESGCSVETETSNGKEKLSTVAKKEA